MSVSQSVIEDVSDAFGVGLLVVLGLLSARAYWSCRQHYRLPLRAAWRSNFNNGTTARSRSTGDREESDMHPIQHLLHATACGSNLVHLNDALDESHSDFEHYSSELNDLVEIKLKKYVNDGDWQSLSNELSRMKGNGFSNDDRSSYFRIISDEIEKSWPTERTHDMPSFSHLLDQWVENEPNYVDCRLVRIGTGIAWAWHARSACYAHRVGVEQNRLFLERLQRAASEVNIAISLCHSDPLIYQEAITLKMGLGDRNRDIMSVEGCLGALKTIANEPLSYSAHRRALQYYCKKWHGSHEKMFGYARSVASKLPDGHPLWVLIAESHVERFNLAGNIGYWKLQSVVKEIKECYQHAFPGDTKLAVQATSPLAKAREWSCRNYFAFCLMATGQYEDARDQIRVIGKRPTKGFPWWHFEIYKLFVDRLGFDTSSPDIGTEEMMLNPVVATATEEMMLNPVVATALTNVSADDDTPIATAVAVQIV